MQALCGGGAQAWSWRGRAGAPAPSPPGPQGKEPRVTMMPGVAEVLGAAGAAAFVCFGCGVGK